MAEEEASEISKEETQNGAGGSKGRSCKGCLYYSSQLKGNQRNPLCVGFSRALQQVPNYVEPESDIEAASKEGRSLLDFKYACVGYSVFADKKDSLSDQQDPQAELPFCVGIELLVDRRASTAAPVHEHAHRKEDTPILPRPPSTYRPPHPIGDEFISRLYRNAGLVAGGVARNLYRIGHYVKDSLDDILYPYRRRPK